MRRRVLLLRYSRSRSQDLYSGFRSLEGVRRLPLVSPAILYVRFFFSPFSDYFYRVSQITTDPLYYGTVPVSKNLSSCLIAVSYFFCRFSEPYFGRFKQITAFDRQIATVLSYHVKLSLSMVQRLVVNFAKTSAFGTPTTARARHTRGVLWRSSSEKGLRRFSKSRHRYMRRFNAFSLEPRQMFLRGYAANFRKYQFTLLHRASYMSWVWNFFLEEGSCWDEGSYSAHAQSDFIGDMSRNFTLSIAHTRKQLYKWFKTKFGDGNQSSDEDSDHEEPVEDAIYDEGFTRIGLLRQRLLSGNIARCSNSTPPLFDTEQRPDFRVFNALALFEVWQNFLYVEDSLKTADFDYVCRQDWLCFLYNSKDISWINGFQHNSALDDMFSTSCPVPTKLEAMPQVSLCVYWDVRMEIGESRLRTLNFDCEESLDFGVLRGMGTLLDGTQVVIDNPGILQHSELSAYKATLWDYAMLETGVFFYDVHMAHYRALSESRLHLHGIAVSTALEHSASLPLHECILV